MAGIEENPQSVQYQLYELSVCNSVLARPSFLQALIRSDHIEVLETRSPPALLHVCSYSPLQSTVKVVLVDTHYRLVEVWCRGRMDVESAG
jgi:hypothetical protein